MKKRVLALALALSMSVGIVLSGCDNGGTASTPADDKSSTPPQSEGGDKPSGGDVGSFEDIEFPDSLPTKIVMADGLDYSYDDMAERYSIEIISTNYGKEALPADKDPVNMWLSKKFNMDITLTSPSGEDYSTVVSARFAAQDYPDVLQLPSRDYGFTLSDQGLTLDAKNIYPYMLLSNNYTTKNMIKWSTNAANGEIPFITKYHIQDSSWGFAVREDWLQALKTEWPTTKDELLAFAKAVTFNDPDGNGKDDTYFMTGGGEGKGWGMLGGFSSMFGNPAMHAENGELVHPYFDDTEKKFLQWLNELVNAKVLIPDWFTKNWEQCWADAANDQLAMCWFPAGPFYPQVVTNNGTEKTEERLNAWKYYKEAPIEGGKYPANGNPGYCWAFIKPKFDGQDGKVKRVAHMIDTMTMGGENFFESIQGSIPEVYTAAGIEVKGDRVASYNDEGTAFYIATTKAEFPFGNSATDPATAEYDAVGIWQMFGLVTTYQISYTYDGMDEMDKLSAEKSNEGCITISSYDRWPNDGLLVTLTGKAAEDSAANGETIFAKEYEFVSGKRSFDEWDDFTKEWLEKLGGKLIIQQAAEQLGVPVPDYAK